MANTNFLNISYNLLGDVMKVGLCLAGGGIKGAAHIGVLKAFEEANIDFKYVAGTSSGSIVSALYASRIFRR